MSHSTVHWILQARILDWEAMPSLEGISPTLGSWTIACQAPLSMGFSRQEYWSREGEMVGQCSLSPLEPLPVALTPLGGPPQE